MKKILAFVLAMIMMMSFVVGCGEKAPAADDGADAAPTNEYGLPDTDKLVIWTFVNEGENLYDWQAENVEKYQEMYPDVEVEFVACGREVLTTFQSKLNDKDAEDFPDIIYQKDGTLAPLAAEGLLYSLDEVMETKAFDQDMAWKDTFVGNFYDGMKINGVSYFVPLCMYVHGFFYDANMFKELGISVPTTWDEFLAVCETLKANGIAPLALDGLVDDYNDWWFIRFAERLAGVEALDQAAAGEITFASNPAFLQSAKYIEELVTKGYFQDGAAGSVFPAAQALWVQGQAGMLFCGAWIPSEMNDLRPADMDMKMFAMPVLPNSVSEKHEEIWGNCAAITVDGKNKANAINYLKLESSMGTQEAKAANGETSPLIGAPAVPELDAMESMIAEATSVSTIYGGTAMYAEWYTSVFGPTCTKLITGALSAEAFIAELDTATANFYAG